MRDISFRGILSPLGRGEGVGSGAMCALNPLASNAFRFFNQGTMSAKSKRLIAILTVGVILVGSQNPPAG